VLVCWLMVLLMIVGDQLFNGRVSHTGHRQAWALRTGYDRAGLMTCRRPGRNQAVPLPIADRKATPPSP
jgi:hypothetical protein